MISSNHLGASTEDEKSSTFVTLPLDFIKDSNGQTTLIDIHDLFIGQLPDGSYCILNNGEEVY